MTARRPQLMFPAARHWPKHPIPRVSPLVVLNDEDQDSYCDGCRQPLSEVPNGPMLNDDVWHRLADRRERFLCFPCMLRRADYRLVNLSVASLKPCPVNMFHSPMSWFDLFMTSESEPPPNIEEWNRIRASWDRPGWDGHGDQLAAAAE